MATKIISCVAVSSYQEINLKYVALYMCYKETPTYSYIAFSSGKVDGKNKLFPLWIQTSLICVLCILQLLSTKEMYVVAHSIFFSFLKSKGVISAEMFTFDFVLGWHKTWHFALKGLFSTKLSDSVFLCFRSTIMGIN